MATWFDFVLFCGIIAALIIVTTLIYNFFVSKTIVKYSPVQRRKSRMTLARRKKLAWLSGRTWRSNFTAKKRLLLVNTYEEN